MIPIYYTPDEEELGEEDPEHFYSWESAYLYIPTDFSLVNLTLKNQFFEICYDIDSFRIVDIKSNSFEFQRKMELYPATPPNTFWRYLIEQIFENPTEIEKI
jgi:hypothetical protein